MRESLKPLKSEQPARDKKRRWTQAGSISQHTSDRQQFEKMFKKDATAH